MIKPIVTRTATLGFPEHRFRGYAIFGELTGAASATELLALAITGRRPSKDEVALLDDLAALTTIADPRVWPLKMIRVASAYGGLLAGYAIGHMAIEGDRIGPMVTRYAAELLVAMRERVGDHLDDEEAVTAAAHAVIEGRRRIPGYGVAFRPYDERFVVLDERLAARGRHALPHYRLQRALSDVIRVTRKIEPNIGVGVAAMLLDYGYTPQEAGATVHFLVQHIFVAHAFEGAREPAAVLRALPAESIKYVGAPPRRSPRAG